MSGYTKEIITAGTGPQPTPGQTCAMKYTGTFTDGKVFDSNENKNKLFEFQIGRGQVIKGWDEGVATMKKGEKAKFTIQPDFGYGARGVPGAIPPNSVLVFVVELIEIK